LKKRTKKRLLFGFWWNWVGGALSGRGAGGKELLALLYGAGCYVSVTKTPAL
jgi:chitinase